MDEETELVIVPESELPAIPDSELARKVVEAIDMIAEKMRLETPHPKTKRRVRGARTVGPEFISSLIVAVETVPLFKILKGSFDIAEAREVLEGREDLRIVTERVSRLLASLNYTMEARWAKVVEKALATYSAAANVAEDEMHADAAAHVEILRRHLRRANSKKKKKAEKP